MISKMPTVSVIVPVFNAVRTVKRTYKCLKKQNYNNLEIIFVNDCSTDNSLATLKEIAFQDSRIRIINNECNERALRSRWIGCRAATGQYILFCDADDEMPTNAIYNLVTRAITEHADIVLGSIVTTVDRFRLLKGKAYNLVHSPVIDRSFSGVEIKSNFSLAFFGKHSIPVTSPAKLIARSLIDYFKAVSPPRIHIFDDVYLNLILFNHAEKISFIPQVVYFYKYGGVTSTFDKRLLGDIQLVAEFRKNFITEQNKKAALHSSFVELRNTVEAYFLNSLLIGKYNEKEFINLAEELQSYPIYKEIQAYFKDKEVSDFMSSLLSGDLSNAYSYLVQDYKKMKLKRTVRRALAKFISKI